MVVYADDELRVPLPGWSLEEVHSIVRSIQEGDWSYFHEALSPSGATEIGAEVTPLPQNSPMLQVPPNGVFLGPLASSAEEEVTPAEDDWAHFSGSPGSSGLPELEPLESFGAVGQAEWTFTAISDVVDQFGIVAWVVWSCCSLLGVFVLVCWLYEGLLSITRVEGEPGGEGTCPGHCERDTSRPKRPLGEVLSWGRALLGVWVVSVMQRFGVVLLGTTVHPRRVVLCLHPGSQVSVIPAFERPEWALWLLLMLLMGLCGPAKAQLFVFRRRSSGPDRNWMRLLWFFGRGMQYVSRRNRRRLM